MNLDLLEIKKVYVIGIKGSGVIAIIQILNSMGIEVIGSDVKEKFSTDTVLRRLKIKYFENFSAGHIPDDADLIIYSTAYNEDNNAEFREARRRNFYMISYPEILSYIFNQKYGIAVAGTHGKTTTTALLAQAFKNAGFDPTAVVGGQVIDWKGNALIGEGEYFVAEADEFQNKFQFYDPKAVVLTAVDWDHPDFFDTFSDYKKAFENFISRIPRSGFLVVSGDSADTLDVAKYSVAETITYGFSEDNDFQISAYRFFTRPVEVGREYLRPVQSFEILRKNKTLGCFQIQLAGKHNVLNTMAVVAVCCKLKLNMEKVREALADFKGVARRFEYIGSRNGAVLIDDYGHHPEEIKATLEGAREIYAGKNIHVIFHPHTFSRTKALLSEFSQSFGNADKVIVLDIYGSAREERGGVHSRDLVGLINKYDYAKASYIPTISEAVEYLKDKIGKEDVVIAMGAGNVWEVVEKLKEPSD